jgi:hypothetical protein
VGRGAALIQDELRTVRQGFANSEAASRQTASRRVPDALIASGDRKPLLTRLHQPVLIIAVFAAFFERKPLLSLTRAAGKGL